MSDDMLGDIDDAVIDGDDLQGHWKEYKILYCNGIVKGNEPLLNAVDTWEALDGESATQKEVFELRGDLMYQLLVQLNDIKEEDARALATRKNLKEVIAVWSEL